MTPKFGGWNQKCHELFQLGNEHGNLVFFPNIRHEKFTDAQASRISVVIQEAMTKITYELETE